MTRHRSPEGESGRGCVVAISADAPLPQSRICCLNCPEGRRSKRCAANLLLCRGNLSVILDTLVRDGTHHPRFIERRSKRLRARFDASSRCHIRMPCRKGDRPDSPGLRLHCGARRDDGDIASRECALPALTWQPRDELDLFGQRMAPVSLNHERKVAHNRRGNTRTMVQPGASKRPLVLISAAASSRLSPRWPAARAPLLSPPASTTVRSRSAPQSSSPSGRSLWSRRSTPSIFPAGQRARARRAPRLPAAAQRLPCAASPPSRAYRRR